MMCMSYDYEDGFNQERCNLCQSVSNLPPTTLFFHFIVTLSF